MITVYTLNKQFSYPNAVYEISETGVLSVYRGLCRVAVFAAGHWKRAAME